MSLAYAVLVFVLALALAVVVLAFASVFLPPLVTAIRMRVFTMINKDKGYQIPNKKIHGKSFIRLYKNPAADGRSDCELSNFFWYHLSPGPEIHQEQIENGEMYNVLSRATTHFLQVKDEHLRHLANKHADRQFYKIKQWNFIRLREFVFPICAKIMYELVFHEECPDSVSDLITDSAGDVITALKCCKLRDMPKRFRLTEWLEKKLEGGTLNGVFGNDKKCDYRTQALHIQGAFCHTGVVQTSEAIAHTIIAISQHPRVLKKLFVDGEIDKRYMNDVLDESFRVWPLFGIANRVTSSDITINDVVIPKGTCLCFNYPEFHHSGYEDPLSFRPERWRSRKRTDSNFIPFGVKANRQCPAIRVAPIIIKEVVRVALKSADFHTSLKHTRSMPDRGLCVMVPKNTTMSETALYYAKGFMKAQEAVENLTRSVKQLIYGSYMLAEAKKQRLAQTYFEQLRAENGNRNKR